LNIGDRVQILPGAEYGNEYKGEFGHIERNPDRSNIGVKLDNYINRSSGYGVFWFSKENLKIVKERDKDYMLSGYKVATIEFKDGSNPNSEYYYALYDDDIGIGDYVVVHTGHHGMSIAEVVNIDKDKPDRVLYGREVIDKIDLDKYNERKEKAAKIKELKNKMETRVRDLQKTVIYEILAEKDPELKSMLDEMKRLTSNEQ
jgi:hypothetical protein